MKKYTISEKELEGMYRVQAALREMDMGKLKDPVETKRAKELPFFYRFTNGKNDVLPRAVDEFLENPVAWDRLQDVIAIKKYGILHGKKTKLEIKEIK